MSPRSPPPESLRPSMTSVVLGRVGRPQGVVQSELSTRADCQRLRQNGVITKSRQVLPQRAAGEGCCAVGPDRRADDQKPSPLSVGTGSRQLPVQSIIRSAAPDDTITSLSPRTVSAARRPASNRHVHQVLESGIRDFEFRKMLAKIRW